MSKKFIVTAATNLNGYLESEFVALCETPEEAHDKMMDYVINLKEEKELEDWYDKVEVVDTTENVTVYLDGNTTASINVAMHEMK